MPAPSDEIQRFSEGECAHETVYPAIAPALQVPQERAVLKREAVGDEVLSEESTFGMEIVFSGRFDIKTAQKRLQGISYRAEREVDGERTGIVEAGYRRRNLPVGTLHQAFHDDGRFELLRTVRQFIQIRSAVVVQYDAVAADGLEDGVQPLVCDVVGLAR